MQIVLFIAAPDQKREKIAHEIPVLLRPPEAALPRICRFGPAPKLRRGMEHIGM